MLKSPVSMCEVTRMKMPISYMLRFVGVKEEAFQKERFYVPDFIN